MKQLIVEETLSEGLHDIMCRIYTNQARITDLGLYNGKMGLAIFLHHYADCYNNTLCTQLADRLVDDVRNDVMELTSIDYETGISGIEAGLQYLLKQGFIDAGRAAMPQAAEEAVYTSIAGFSQEHVHDHLYQLTGVMKYCMLDHRRGSLNGIGPFSDTNRRDVAHILHLFSCIDVAMVPQLDYRNLLRVLDVLSMLFTTGFRLKDLLPFFPVVLQGLDAILFGNADCDPFRDGFNPFYIALALFQAYDRTHNQHFATFAVRILTKFEAAAGAFYTIKDITDADLLRHALACKKLHVVLMEPYFGNCATECLDVYRERKRRTNSIVQYNNGGDLSLKSGYVAEGMALLTLQEQVGFDWLEELMGYY